MNKQLLYNNKKLFTSFTVSFVLYASLENNILEEINKLSPSLAELKVKFYNFPLIETLVQVLERLELVEYVGDNIVMTEGGLLFLEQNEQSLKPSAMFALNEGIKSWMHLHEGIKTGETPFTLAFKQQPFDYFSDNPDSFERFALSMRQSTKRKDVQKLFQEIELTNVKNVLDVGCGDGTLLRQIRDLWKPVNTIGFDLSYVVNRSSQQEINEDIEFLEGDFFKDDIPHADVYILSRILHDWDDEKSKLILENIKYSMSENSRLLVLDKVIDHTSEDLDTLLSHLNVWIMCGGRERTHKEFSDLFTCSGFKIKSSTQVGNVGLFELILK